MDTALIVALLAGATAVVSAAIAARSARKVERLRHTDEAMDRLGSTTGTLRLQLFLSTRSVVQRLRQYHNDRPGHPFTLSADPGARPSEYHGCGLLIFRLMRPLAVSYMIEQATFLGDLLLEPAMVDLLRFNHAAFEMLTGDTLGEPIAPGSPLPMFEMEHCFDPPGKAPPPRFSEPIHAYQRLRASYLRSAAAALIVSDHDRKRCMTHDEFLYHWERPTEMGEFHDRIQPLKATLDGFSPMASPVFWLRLVGYAYACKWFHETVRAEAMRLSHRVAYSPVPLPVQHMLEVAEAQAGRAQARGEEWFEPQQDARRYLAENAAAYERRFADIVSGAL